MSRSLILPMVITFSAATAGAQSAPDESPPVGDEPEASEPQAQNEDGSMPAAPPPVEERPAAPAPSTDHPAPTLDRFHEALDPYGRWVETPEYGLVWIPSNVDSQWRPYANGRWENTDEGWTFVANESWGWAPFHYGRWVYYPAYGWSWLPGYEWAPAWVTWRYGAGVVAWAPLGPVGVSVAYYGLPSLWLAVTWPLFYRPLSWGCFYPTTRIGMVFRSTYFAGVPRRGFYHAPPRTYFANRGGEWRREMPRSVGAGRDGRGWEIRGRGVDGRGAPPARTPPRDRGYGRGPLRSATSSPAAPARPATFTRTMPARGFTPPTPSVAHPSVGWGGSRPSVGSGAGSRGAAGGGGRSGGAGHSGGGHGGGGHGRR